MDRLEPCWAVQAQWWRWEEWWPLGAGAGGRTGGRDGESGAWATSKLRSGQCGHSSLRGDERKRTWSVRGDR